MEKYKTKVFDSTGKFLTDFVFIFPPEKGQVLYYKDKRYMIQQTEQYTKIIVKEDQNEV
jgi:hypothetical protein